MTFSTSYIINENLPSDPELNNLIKNLIILQSENIWTQGGNPLIISELYKSMNISGLQFLYAMQDSVGTVAKDLGSKQLDGTYKNVTLNKTVSNVNILKVVGFNEQGYLQLPETAGVKGLSSYTLTAVVNLKNDKPGQNIYYESVADSNNHTRLQVSWNTDGDNRLTVVARSNKSTQTGQSVKTSEIPTGFCILHVIVNIKNNSIKVYRNGSLLSATGAVNFDGDETVEDALPLVPAKFGNHASNDNFWFVGDAAYFALYNRELTDVEIQKHAQSAGLSN